MKKINILIVLALVSLLAATGASAANDDSLEGIYCGTLEGTYTAKDSAGNEITGLGLTAEFRADFNTKKVRILSVDTSGSTPAILDDTLNVKAKLNEDNKIVVTASGKCGMENEFSGKMIVDPCDDFKVISNSGEVTVKQTRGKNTKYELTGVFDIEAEKCCDLPEGTYCGTLEGTYNVKDGSIPGNFILKADFTADFDNKKIKILRINTTGSNPGIDDDSLKVKAKLNKDKTITVTADGKNTKGNDFHGEMVIDPCNEFEVISNTGWVKVVINEQGQRKKIDLEGEFEVTELEECCKLPDGIYCGTVEGTYTATAPDGTTIPGLGLKADFKVDFDSGKIEILSVETTEGSMIDDDSLTVTATLNEKKKIIKVVVTGKCMENNNFKGVMKIDPCDDFKVTSASGWVKVKQPDRSKIKYTVTGNDFEVDIWSCDQACDLPEGTYCGILEGKYTAETLTGDELGPFVLKADVKADFESGVIEVLNVNTDGSTPEVAEVDVEATLNKKTGIITVIATGKSATGNEFKGTMHIDVCDEFKIIENYGTVNVPGTVLDLEGKFVFDVEKCGDGPCKLPEGTYCGTLDGTYTATTPTGDILGSFKLKADVKADFESGVIEVLNVNTDGSTPKIDEVDVEATLNKKTGIITVIATGKSATGNEFKGTMHIDACDEFEITENYGTADVQGIVMDLEGKFVFDVKKCEDTCELPTGQYIGTIDGKFTNSLMGERVLGLSAVITADFDTGDVQIPSGNIVLTEKNLEIIGDPVIQTSLDKNTGIIEITATGKVKTTVPIYGEIETPYEAVIIIEGCDDKFTVTEEYVLIDIPGTDQKMRMDGEFTVTLEKGIVPP